MLYQVQNNFSRILLLTLILFLTPAVAMTQSLELKLAQKPDYMPLATSPREQLIEVAQHYKIPMGIEWTNEVDEKMEPSALAAQPTVISMLQSILKRVPGYTAEVKDGVVSIKSASLAANSQNFLNLTLPEYNISNDNVFGAEATLRGQILRTLHPERYLRGSNGGYGYGVPRDDSFDLKKISISGKNLTVRDVLNLITSTNGNALWIVDMILSKKMRNEPFFAQPCQNDFCWKIIPLSGSESTKGR